MPQIPRFLSAHWLRKQYLNKTLTPQNVIGEIITRAKADQRFNIWITPPDYSWIEPYLEGLNSLDIESAPLWGIPFAIKDNIDLKSVPTTAGCPEYAYYPGDSAIVVKKLIAAGAIPIGKTNMDQFATGLVGTRSPYGEVHNALREELISGGSSSGSAVAVARGQAAFALGTDTAGSGRVPAALNDIYGFKPSCGSWSIKGIVPACISLDCISVFANSLADCLIVDQIVKGFEASDPWSRNITASRWEKPKKLYLPEQKLYFYGPYAREYETAWDMAEKKLFNLGFEVQRIDYSFFEKAAAILYEGPWIAERWADLGDFVQTHSEAVHEVTAKILRSGSGLDAAALFKALHQLQAYKLVTNKLLQEAVLVMPTAGGTWSREEVRQDPVGTNLEMGRYTNHCNLLDLSAISIPVGFAGEKLPFGITLFALNGAERLITAVAEKFKNGSSLIAVCGLHMRGFALEYQMYKYGASFVRDDTTAACYQLVKLPTDPPKPGLIKKAQGGASIALEIWEIPNENLGGFINQIPAPLGIGSVSLMDGSTVLGFVCEGYIADVSEDISHFGSWKESVGTKF
jgi:allophanate hydrolase